MVASESLRFAASQLKVLESFIKDSTLFIGAALLAGDIEIKHYTTLEFNNLVLNGKIRLAQMGGTITIEILEGTKWVPLTPEQRGKFMLPKP